MINKGLMNEDELKELMEEDHGNATSKVQNQGMEKNKHKSPKCAGKGLSCQSDGSTSEVTIYKRAVPVSAPLAESTNEGQFTK